MGGCSNAAAKARGPMSEQTVFLAALDKDVAERGAFLDWACAGDAELRRGVETLLRLHDAMGLHGGPHRFLDVPAIEQLAAADVASGNAAAGLCFLGPAARPGALGPPAPH